MQAISLAFLGSFEVIADARVIDGFRTDKTRALLAYLALEAARPQRREQLAALFWPESDHVNARYNLRLTLHRLRRTLDTAAPGVAAQLFTVTRSSIEFHASAAQVDVLRFQQLLHQCETHPHADLRYCSVCLASLQQAVDLYRGELLAGFALADAPAFEEWLLLRRETLHHLALLALHSLAAAHEAQGQDERALRFAQRKLALDSYREETHRQVMRLLARCGFISQALAQYERCYRLLREEVGIEPSKETAALAEQIRSGVLDESSRRAAESDAVENGAVESGAADKLNAAAGQRASLTTAPMHDAASPLHNLPAYLPPLIGRAEQLEQLRAWMRDPAQRLVTIVGMGGMGKTRLALALMEALTAESAAPFPHPFPHGVWFVPLVGVQAAAEDLSVNLAGATLSVLGLTPPDGADLARALLNGLAQRQLLIVFDNFEHLLQAEQAAAAATQFLLTLLQAAPGVTLLITSRLPLQLLAEKVLRLEGLPVPNEDAARAALSEQAQAAGVHLFVYHAQRVAPGFSLTADNLPAVVERWAACRWRLNWPRP